MMKRLIAISSVPFGVPIGWIAARIAEGKYQIAAIDAVSIIFILAVLILIASPSTAKPSQRE